MDRRSAPRASVECANVTRSPNTLNVGLLIDSWQPDRGGAERALDDLGRWLDARGFRVHVFARDASVRPPGEFHAVAARRWPWPSRAAFERRLGTALTSAAARCDVTVGVRHLPRVDLYWPHGGSHAAGLEGARSADAGRTLPPSHARMKGRHKAFVELEHDLLAGGAARRIACVSQLVHDEFAARYPQAIERLALEPNGVDTERFHPRERASSGLRLRTELHVDAATPLITFVARNPVLKGLPALLAALAGLSSRRWQLLIAGPDERERWRDAAQRAGIDPARVAIRTHADPIAVAAAGDLCVLPTWRDTCGLVVLEALSSGTPVVTTRRAGAAELITSQITGRVVADPGDIDVLRAAIACELDRSQAGSTDREAVRRAVSGRDRSAWLAGIERSILELA